MHTVRDEKESCRDKRDRSPKTKWKEDKEIAGERRWKEREIEKRENYRREKKQRAQVMNFNRLGFHLSLYIYRINNKKIGKLWTITCQVMCHNLSSYAP